MKSLFERIHYVLQGRNFSGIPFGKTADFAFGCKLSNETVWQYWLWTGGTKLERFLPKNQHTQRNLLNFENWVNGEVSKIGHHFRK